MFTVSREIKALLQKIVTLHNLRHIWNVNCLIQKE